MGGVWVGFILSSVARRCLNFEQGLASAASMEYAGVFHTRSPLMVEVEICLSRLEAFTLDSCKVSVRTTLYSSIPYWACFTSWISWYVQLVSLNLDDFWNCKLGGYVSISRKFGSVLA